MNEFTVGVVSSLAATALTVAAGWLLSRRARLWAVRLAGRSTGTGVRSLYRRQREAADDLARDLARARWVGVLAGRGNELTREPFAPLWSGAPGGTETIRVALPDPSGIWLERRAESVHRADRGLRPGVLREQVRSNLSYLAEVARHTPSLELRLYESPNLYRLIVTDEVAYITLYEDSRHSRNSPCVAVRRPGFLYEFAVRAFTTGWEASVPGSPERPSPRTGDPR
ncbi:hypothetical protein GCM10022221_71160 [Actinocorallia aurea]